MVIWATICICLEQRSVLPKLDPNQAYCSCCLYRRYPSPPYCDAMSWQSLQLRTWPCRPDRAITPDARFATPKFMPIVGNCCSFGWFGK
jgi:hypothetical protein